MSESVAERGESAVQKITPSHNAPQRAPWEPPQVEELGSVSEDTRAEFNFLADANQLT